MLFRSPKGSKSGSSELKGKDDNTSEYNETITAKIISAVGASVSDTKSVTVVITDDDSTSVDLSVSTNSIKEGTSQYAKVTATLDKVSEKPVTVYLSGSGDGIKEGDYLFSLSNDTSKAVANLVAHYMFNGNAEDETEYQNNGEIDGAILVNDRFGNAQSAMYFDGSNDQIRVRFNESLQIKDDITISAWVKNEETNYATDFILRSPNGYYGLQIHERDNDTKFEFYANAGGS